MLRRLERATILAEAPLRRLSRRWRLNPLPHAGTITVFLLLVIVVSGLYLTMFFEFGYEASYRAVSTMEVHPIQRTVRAVHRYASGAFVLTTLVHAWRIAVGRRFTGPRRWRWATGVLALGVAFGAGVTGYWLIFDTRAQAIAETLAGLVGGLSAQWELALLLPSGSGVVASVLVWTVHVVLTVIVGWAIWRHLRVSRHRWMPPWVWSALMGGALVVTSIAYPAGMLPPGDPALAPARMPLDPFIMFLLPPSSVWPWPATLAVLAILAGVAAIPWLLRRADPPVVEIVESRCTGCELCVLDCPYLALRMVPNDAGSIAAVVAQRCVGCGICLGSCSFGAIEGLGSRPIETDRTGRVVVVCEHQTRSVPPGSARSVVEVRCAGEVHPRVVASLVRGGAADVQLIGCAAGECAYGIGNVVASERVGRGRRPFLPRTSRGVVSTDWITPGELLDALGEPGSREALHPDPSSAGWGRLLPLFAVVLMSVLGVRVVGEARFAPDVPGPVIRIGLDHEAGETVAGSDRPLGEIRNVTVRRDGVATSMQADGSGVVDVPVSAGPADTEVVVGDGSNNLVVASGRIAVFAGERHLVRVQAEPDDPASERGRRLFDDPRTGGCQVCHVVEGDRTLVGPSLAGIGVAAGARVAGLGAEEYLRQSILDPDAFVVEGYRAGQMPPVYGERLTDRQMDDLVAYLLTLEEDG